MITVYSIKPHHGGFGMFDRSVEGQTYPELDSVDDYETYVRSVNDNARRVQKDDEEYQQIEAAKGNTYNEEGEIIGWIQDGIVSLEMVVVKKATTFIYHEDGGHQETIEGVTTMAEALERAEEMCKDGEWGNEGALINVWVEEIDEDGEQIDRDDIEVSIEPDHEEMIRRAGGDTDCEHEWTSEGEGGCTENPGVWSLGGTTMLFKSHCEKCGLKREEVHHGSQRNPGQADKVTYSID